MLDAITVPTPDMLHHDGCTWPPVAQRVRASRSLPTLLVRVPHDVTLMLLTLCRSEGGIMPMLVPNDSVHWTREVS